MKTYVYKPRGVCARELGFTIKDGKLHNVHFMGGCNGNLTAISKLVEGMEASKVIELLKGNDCGGKGTSCADQLALAIETALLAKVDWQPYYNRDKTYIVWKRF